MISDDTRRRVREIAAVRLAARSEPRIGLSADFYDALEDETREVMGFVKDLREGRLMKA